MKSIIRNCRILETLTLGAECHERTGWIFLGQVNDFQLSLRPLFHGV